MSKTTVILQRITESGDWYAESFITPEGAAGHSAEVMAEYPDSVIRVLELRDGVFYDVTEGGSDDA
jgi:hypothetical protein